jgi:hypothetical protein
MRLALLSMIVLLSGCAGAPKAWDRGTLARPEMALEPDPLLASYRDHTFVSKEQARGRAAAAGGGCGCSN